MSRPSSNTSVRTSQKKLYSFFCPAPSKNIKNPTSTLHNTHNNQNEDDIESDDDDNDDFEITLSSLAQKENKKLLPQRRQRRLPPSTQQTHPKNTTTNRRKKRIRNSTETQQTTRRQRSHHNTSASRTSSSSSSSCSTANNSQEQIVPPLPLESMECSTTTTSTSTSPPEQNKNHLQDEEKESEKTQQHDNKEINKSSNTSSSSSLNGIIPLKSKQSIIPSSTTSTTMPQNIVLQLAKRSSCVKSASRTKRFVTMATPPTTSIPRRGWPSISLDTSLPWTRQSHLSFDTGYGGGGQSTCFAWDEEGVLLAVGTDTKHIHIYDWDTIIAQDMSIKRTHTRRQSHKRQNRQSSPLTPPTTTTTTTTTEEEPYYYKEEDEEEDIPVAKLQPTWTFSTPHEVSYLRWNPSHPDQLAVGFRTSSQLRVYDISKIAEEATKASRRTRPTTNMNRHSSFSSSPPPPKTWIVLQPSLSHVPRTQGIRSLLFLPNNHIIVAYKYGSCTLWKIPPMMIPSSQQQSQQQQQQQYQPRWYYSTQEEISDMMPIGSHGVLLGGSLGNMVLLNWRRVTRKAFSSQSSPLIEYQWDTYENLPPSTKKSKSVSAPKATTRTTTVPPPPPPSSSIESCVPARSWMGIQTFLHKPEYTVNHKITTWSKQTIVWVTKCGWIMSLKLDICPKQYLSPKGGKMSSSLSSSRNSSSSSSTPAAMSSRVVVLRRSPQMEIRNTQGEVFKHDTYSLPSSAPAADSLDNCLVWYDTPKTTRILPHPDKHVLAAENDNSRMVSFSSGGTTTPLESSSSRDATTLSFLDVDANKIVKINLAKKDGPPLALALHPSRDWMVVAGDDGNMNLWNRRRGLLDDKDDDDDGSKIPPQQE